MKKRVLYYGTDGSQEHKAIAIRGKYSQEELDDMTSYFKTFYHLESRITNCWCRRNGIVYLGLGLPYSADTDKDGSLTIVFVQDSYRDDVIEVLQNEPFVREKFIQVFKKYNYSKEEVYQTLRKYMLFPEELVRWVIDNMFT